MAASLSTTLSSSRLLLLLRLCGASRSSIINSATTTTKTTRRFAHNILDTPEQKHVYPSLKRVAEAAEKAKRALGRDTKNDTEDGQDDRPKGGRKEDDQQVDRDPADYEEEEPSNRLLDASRRYDNAYKACKTTQLRDDDTATVVQAAAVAAGLIDATKSMTSRDWRDASLAANQEQKFAFLSACCRRLGRAVPNSRLADMATVGAALEFFSRPPELPADPLKRLAAGAATGELPDNVHVQVEPIRFDDNPAFFDGVDAFPGRDTLVTQPWARAKYRSKIAPAMRSPRWTGVGRNPGSLSDMSGRKG